MLGIVYIFLVSARFYLSSSLLHSSFVVYPSSCTRRQFVERVRALFCRFFIFYCIAKYISLDLFCFVNVISSCSLIPSIIILRTDLVLLWTGACNYLKTSYTLTCCCCWLEPWNYLKTSYTLTCCWQEPCAYLKTSHSDLLWTTAL